MPAGMLCQGEEVMSSSSANLRLLSPPLSDRFESGPSLGRSCRVPYTFSVILS